MIGLVLGVTALLAALAVLVYVVLSRARVAVGAELVPVETAASIADGARRLFAPRVAAPRAATPTMLPALRARLGTLAAKVSGSSYARRSQARLDRAGNPTHWDAQRLLAVKGAGMLLGLVLGFAFGAKAGGAATVVAPLVLAAAGLFLPDLYVHNLGEHRQDELRRGLPDAMDILTVCVEAGLGFDAALGRVARNVEGPFGEECARVLQEMQIGSSRAQALRALADRTDVTELSAFVTAVVQSGELGISIGDVLREQSAQMRIKRRQRAEERAQKLQVKLLFPLILCLLPAMFVVIMGPAAMQVLQFFHSAGR